MIFHIVIFIFIFLIQTKKLGNFGEMCFFLLKIQLFLLTYWEYLTPIYPLSICSLGVPPFVVKLLACRTTLRPYMIMG
jgi:hypothetical protein